jgi:hypothetical protein
MSATCRDCGKEIIWLKHDKTGKSAPIERDRSKLGNIVISEEQGLYRIATEAEYDKHLLADSPILRLNHFASCPNAKEFRKKK